MAQSAPVRVAIAQVGWNYPHGDPGSFIVKKVSFLGSVNPPRFSRSLWNSYKMDSNLKGSWIHIFSIWLGENRRHFFVFGGCDGKKKRVRGRNIELKKSELSSTSLGHLATQTFEQKKITPELLGRMKMNQFFQMGWWFNHQQIFAGKPPWCLKNGGKFLRHRGRSTQDA